jgi:hypothetical protein
MSAFFQILFQQGISVTQHGKHTINKTGNFKTLLIPLLLNFNASRHSVYPLALHEDFYIVFTHMRKHRHLEQNELST